MGWKGGGGHKKVDFNHDDHISREELAQWISMRADGSSVQRLGAASAVVPLCGSGRFRSATERLPKGLPDSFLQKDRDGDGQVWMAEWTTAWTEAEAARFQQFDLSGDGVITPEECLKALGLRNNLARSVSAATLTSCSRSWTIHFAV